MTSFCSVWEFHISRQHLSGCDIADGNPFAVGLNFKQLPRVKLWCLIIIIIIEYGFIVKLWMDPEFEFIILNELQSKWKVSISLHSAGIRTLVTEMSLSCPSWWMEDNWVKYIGSAPITNHTHQQTRPQPPARPVGWSWMQICRVLHSAHQIISLVYLLFIYIENLQEIYT